MDKLTLILAILMLALTVSGLQIGECVQRHSDGWSCLKCRDNYHLLEGKCYIDILGCTEYQDGNICKQCDTNYMLVNNLCCDPICLSKIFSTHKEEIGQKIYSSNAFVLNQILPMIQKGPLAGSTYRLEAIQSKKYTNITRYFLLYQIISSYTADYISKRAVVDYDEKTTKALIVDWSPVAKEADYTILQKKDVDTKKIQSTLVEFEQLYSALSELENYKISITQLANVLEYNVLAYDTWENNVNLKVFYRNAGSIVLLVDENDNITTFQPYKKTYSSNGQIKTAAAEKLFGNAMKFVLNQGYFKQDSLTMAIEWANDPKLTIFKFYAQNTTHSFEVVAQHNSRPMTNFTISYDWACRQNTKFNSCGGQAYWNGALIQAMNPPDYTIHSSSYPVTVKSSNSLIFKGTGVSDGYGLAIDNVNLHRLGENNNYIINGDFEAPDVKKQWGLFNNIKGWTGNQIQIGYGPIYNKNWKSQVCQLDANANYQISQTVSTNLTALYDTSTSYIVLSLTITPKKPASPIVIDIPVIRDITSTHSGEIQETIQYSQSNEVIKTYITLVITYTKTFQKNVPSSKQSQYDYVISLFQHAPLKIQLIKNCKYTEIAFIFRVDSKYIFVYFIQQIKTKQLSYVGLLESLDSNIDPSFISSAKDPFSADQFKKVFGYQPTFSASSIRDISLRETKVFRRKSLSVLTSGNAISNYYMYYKLSSSGPQKLFTCACKGSDSQSYHEIWTDALGLEGKKTNDIDVYLKGDSIGSQIYKFIQISIPQTSIWQLSQISVNEYELKLEYIFVFRKNTQYLIAIILHDKKDHSNALVSSDILEKENYDIYIKGEGKFILKERLPYETVTNKVLTTLLGNSDKNIAASTILGVIRTYLAPSTERNLVIVEDTLKQYWILVSICNHNKSTTFDPILEEAKSIDFSTVKKMIASSTTTGASEETVKQAHEKESITSGVIFDGEIFLIQKNVKEEKLSEQMKSIIGFIKKSHNLQILPGIIYNIEQHSDAVVTEFAISYLQISSTKEQKIYTRYFVIKPNDKTKPLYYMGKDKTYKNPQENIYFGPSSALKPSGNEQLFKQAITGLNKAKKTVYEVESIDNIWVTAYPLGIYSVIYLKTTLIQAAAYMVRLETQNIVIEYYQSKNQKVGEIIPIIKIDGNSKNNMDGIVRTENLKKQDTKQGNDNKIKVQTGNGESKQEKENKKEDKQNQRQVPKQQKPKDHSEPTKEAMTPKEQKQTKDHSQPTKEVEIPKEQKPKDHSEPTKIPKDQKSKEDNSEPTKEIKAPKEQKPTEDHLEPIGDQGTIEQGQKEHSVVEPIIKPTEEVKEPTTPTEEVKEPIIKPTEEVKEPTTPTEEVKEPIIKPTEEFKEPTTPTEEVKEPIIKPSEEFKEPTTPVEEVKEPIIKPTEEFKEPTTPTEEVQELITPVEEVKEPTTPTEEAKEPIIKPTEEVKEPTTPVEEVQELTTPVEEVKEPTTPTEEVQEPQVVEPIISPTTEFKEPTIQQPTKEYLEPIVDPLSPTTDSALPVPLSYLQLSIDYLFQKPQFKACTLTQFQQTKFTHGALQILTVLCSFSSSPSTCNASISIDSNLSPSLTSFDCLDTTPKSSSPKDSIVIQQTILPSDPIFVPPQNPSLPQTDSSAAINITKLSENIVKKVENMDLQLIDPNEIYEVQALQFIQASQQNDKTLSQVKTGSNAIEQIVIYLRASYAILDHYEVLKVSQDISVTGNTERFVLYFFIGPNAGESYKVYRAIVDYDSTAEQSRILILAFDLFITNNKVVDLNSVKDQASAPKLDIDIAYGYETIDTSSDDPRVKNVLTQIEGKYQPLIKGSSIDKVESLELRNGKTNYKITYLNPTTHLTQKFIVYYDPSIDKVLVLNSVSLPSAQQFQQLSEQQKSKDNLLAELLKHINRIHETEMQGYRLQCVSKGQINEYVEYHITWSSSGKQYRSYVRVELKNAANIVETSFSQVQTISLDHYRLDQFEKMFILNFQKLSDSDLHTDPNFRLAYINLVNTNATLRSASLIGAAQKPLGLGFVYNIYFRLSTGEISRVQVYIQLYSNKLTVKQIAPEDFIGSFLDVSASDNSTKKVIELISKQATNPTLSSTFTVTGVHAKDFLFGRLFQVNIADGQSEYAGLVYHDHSSEQAQLLYWALKNNFSNCIEMDGARCGKCVEGYSKVNGFCVFGCGVICKQVKI